jgi:hypothetical protein
LLEPGYDWSGISEIARADTARNNDRIQGKRVLERCMRFHDDALFENNALTSWAQDKQFVGRLLLTGPDPGGVEHFKRPEEIKRRDTIIANETDALHEVGPIESL